MKVVTRMGNITICYEKSKKNYKKYKFSAFVITQLTIW